MVYTFFSNWFYDEFIPNTKTYLKKIGLVEKAVLYCDNCPSHIGVEALRSEDGKIIVKFLPKNTTPITHPMDAGII